MACGGACGAQFRRRRRRRQGALAAVGEGCGGVGSQEEGQVAGDGDRRQTAAGTVGWAVEVAAPDAADATATVAAAAAAADIDAELHRDFSAAVAAVAAVVDVRK